jgi:GNAT superfamily N-acetyltransferase
MALELDIQKCSISDMDLALGMLKDAAVWLRRKNIKQWIRWLEPGQDTLDWVKAGFDNGEFFIARYNGEPAGVFRLTWDCDRLWEDGKPAGYLHAFTTARKFSGTGAGAVMLEWMRSYCRQNNRHRIRLDCHAWSAPLRSYYEKHGFEPVAEKDSGNGIGIVTLYEMEL